MCASQGFACIKILVYTLEEMEDFGKSRANFDPEEWMRNLNRFLFNILPIIILIVLAVVLASGTFFQVEAEEEAVVLRFGKVTTTVGPGLHFKLPLGIDKVYSAPVKRVLRQEFGYRTGARFSDSVRRTAEDQSLMLTADINCAIVNWAVRYRIKNLSDYLFKHVDPTETLRDVSLTVMSELVGDYSIDEVLTIGRQEIEQKAQGMMQALIDQYETGIYIEAVSLTKVEAPEQVKEAFNAVNKALQVRDTIINEAERKRNSLLPKARGEKLQMIKEASGYAINRINTAKGDSDYFLQLLEEYSRSEEITRRRMYLETMAKVLSKIEKLYIVEDDSGILKLLNLGEKK